MHEKQMEVGGRYLVRRLYTDSPLEVTVREISPSREFFFDGSSWLRIDDYRVLESLPPRVTP